MLAAAPGDSFRRATSPVGELHGLPLPRFAGRVAGVHHGVHDVAVVQRLARRASLVERAEHVVEHVDVAELRQLVADGEEPAARRLGFLGDVACALAGREHLEPGAEEVVRPDRPLGPRDLVTEIHPTAECPRHLELAERARLEPDQADRVVLGLDRVHERVDPREHLDGPVALAHEAADDLDAVAAEVDDRAAARLPPVPEPRRMRTRMCLPRARPRDGSDVPGLHRLHGLQRLRCVGEVLEVAGEHAGALDRVEDALRLLGVARERLRAENRFPVPRAQLDRLLVHVVGQTDDDDVALGMRNRLLEVRRRVRHAVLTGERLGALRGARVDDVDAVAAAARVQRPRIEEADQAGSQHREPMTLQQVAVLLRSWLSRQLDGR